MRLCALWGLVRRVGNDGQDVRVHVAMEKCPEAPKPQACNAQENVMLVRGISPRQPSPLVASHMFGIQTCTQVYQFHHQYHQILRIKQATRKIAFQLRHHPVILYS